MPSPDLRRAPIDGLWRNDSGAELKLVANGSLLSGTYRTRLGAAKLGKAYGVTGWRDGRCLGFSVSWAPESDSLTTWAGLLTATPEGEVVIEAMFLLVAASAIREQVGLATRTDTQAWEAFRTQAVRFRRS